MLELGKTIGELVHPGSVIALSGDLGVGKTTLVQGMARGLNVSEHITSPTFTLIKEYSGRLDLYHADVYRLDDPAEILDLGLEELFSGDGVVGVVLGDRILNRFPEEFLEISISRHVNIRLVEIVARGSEYAGLIEELKEVACSRIG